MKQTYKITARSAHARRPLNNIICIEHSLHILAFRIRISSLQTNKN